MDDYVTDEEWECERAARRRDVLVQEILQGYEGKLQYEVNKYGVMSVHNSRVDFLQCWTIKYHIKNQAMDISIYDDNDYKEALPILLESDDDICEKYVNEMISKGRIISFKRA